MSLQQRVTEEFERHFGSALPVDRRSQVPIAGPEVTLAAYQLMVIVKAGESFGIAVPTASDVPTQPSGGLVP